MPISGKKISDEEFYKILTANKSNELLEGISTNVDVGLSGIEKNIFVLIKEEKGLLGKIVDGIGKAGDVGTGLGIIGDALQKTDVSTPNLQNEYLYINATTADTINKNTQALGKTLSDVGKVLNPVYLAGCLASAYGNDQLGEVLKNNSSLVEVLATAYRVGQANGANYTPAEVDEEALKVAKEYMASSKKAETTSEKTSTEPASSIAGVENTLSAEADAKKTPEAIQKNTSVSTMQATTAAISNAIAAGAPTIGLALKHAITSSKNTAKTNAATTKNSSSMKPLFGNAGSNSKQEAINKSLETTQQKQAEEAKKQQERQDALINASMNDLLTFDRIGKFAIGTPYLSKDMIALVHEGEMIVPKSQNPYAGANRIKAAMNANTADVAAATANNTNNITYTFNSPKALGMSDILREMRLAEQRKALLGV